MDSPRSALLDEVDLEAPWELVEAFSRQPRWRPEDVNRGADMIVARLTALGVPVTVHEPEIYLSIPFEAEVRAAGRMIRAKPPAYSASAPEGVTGEIAYAPAAIFQVDRHPVRQERQGGRAGTAARQDRGLRGLCLPAQGPGARGARRDRGHRRQSRRRHPLGHLHLDLGHARPRRPAAKAHHPGRGREQPGRARADRSCRQRQRKSRWRRVSRRGGIARSSRSSRSKAAPSRRSSSSCTAITIRGTSASATTRPETRRSSRSRACSRVTASGCGVGADRLVAGALDRPLRRLDLVRRHVRDRSRRELRRPDQLRFSGLPVGDEFKDVSWMKETEAFAQRTIKAVTGLDAHGERPHRAGDYSFNNIGISSLMMLSSTMPDALRARRVTTPSAAAAGTSPGIPRTTRSRSPIAASCSGTSRSISRSPAGSPTPKSSPSIGGRSSTSSSRRSTPTSTRPAPASILARRKQPAFRFVARLPASTPTSKPAASGPGRRMT